MVRDPGTDPWSRTIRAYRERQRAHLEAAKAGGAFPPMPPQPPPANNWIPIGPSVVRRGQTANQSAVSGRVRGIAVASGGTRVYAAAANGGVWRSDDTGRSWRSLMDSFDLNPTQQASDSLSCGAIAIDPSDPDRIFVGTGEPPGAPAYYGVGPVVSLDGGQNWATEPVAAGSWQLSGRAFNALAVDPGNTDRVVAATQNGIYRREPKAGGGFEWAQKTVGQIAGGGYLSAVSVVVARSGTTTTFYAATARGPVYSSTDGDQWAVVGTGFPSTDVLWVALAVRPTDPSVVYALVTTLNAAMKGVWRLDTSDNMWRPVTGSPSDVFGSGPSYQGHYDIAIAVDPNDVNRIYIGGVIFYRCTVVTTGSGTNRTYSMTPTLIVNPLHADFHAIVFAPGNSNQLWLGCDGGVFYSTNPTGSGSSVFEPRNTGLQTMTMEHLAQHPTEDAVVFGGSQDNGGLRFTGEEAWLTCAPGDSGYWVVNWNDPYRVIGTYLGGSLFRFTDGGTRFNFTSANVGLAAGERCLGYAPLVGTPRNTATQSEAEILAFGSIRPWISGDYGATWASIPNNSLATDSLLGVIRALAFASATKLYAGTMAIGGTTQDGRVYRFDKTGTTWARTQIDTFPGLAISGPVTAIAVDPADATGNSIYLTYGGTGDYRHVWHFDGTQWQQRSGATAGAATSLLDVQANGVVVDPMNTSDVYVATDIGVWRSTNSGTAWSVYSEGLPDAAVVDLVLHRDRRLLRAATYGRSVYERTLDNAPKAGVELYVRDTQLDQGRFTTIDYLPDPTKQGEIVRHWLGPDIKVDTPDAQGYYQFPTAPGTTIDFLEFTDALTDDYESVATHATANIISRVYVQVHNRGVDTANQVRVMLLLANASAGLPDLPMGYDANVRNGTAVTSAKWQTVGFDSLGDVRVGFPKIAAFNLTSNLLPKPANLPGNRHYCVLAVVHHGSDQFLSTQTITDLLSLTERKAAHKNLTVVAFTGTLPPVASSQIVSVDLNNPIGAEAVIDLSILLDRYPAGVRLHLPVLRTVRALERSIEGGVLAKDVSTFQRWAKRELRSLTVARSRGSWSLVKIDEQIADLTAALGSGIAITAKRGGRLDVRGIAMRANERNVVYLEIERPRGRKDQAHWIDVRQTVGGETRADGGLSIRVQVTPHGARRGRPGR